MGPKSINKKKVTSTPTKFQNNLEKMAGPSAENDGAPSVRNHEEEQDLKVELDSTILLDQPRPRIVLRHQYKRQKMYYSVVPAHDVAREDGDVEVKPEPIASGIPPMKLEVDGFGPASEVNAHEALEKYVVNSTQGALSVEGIVAKRKLPDGTCFDNLLVPGINPNNITDNWTHRQNNPMTLDERIWEENEVKRKEREAKIMERKRTAEAEMPGPSSGSGRTLPIKRTRQSYNLMGNTRS